MPSARHSRRSRAEDVHGQRQLGALDVLEQQRRAVLLLHPVGDLADLEVRIDLDLDPAQLPLPLERLEERAQIVKGHALSIHVRCPRPEAASPIRLAEQMGVDGAYLRRELRQLDDFHSSRA